MGTDQFAPIATPSQLVTRQSVGVWGPTEPSDGPEFLKQTDFSRDRTSSYERFSEALVGASEVGSLGISSDTPKWNRAMPCVALPANGDGKDREGVLLEIWIATA